MLVDHLAVGQNQWYHVHHPFKYIFVGIGMFTGGTGFCRMAICPDALLGPQRHTNLRVPEAMSKSGNSPSWQAADSRGCVPAVCDHVSQGHQQRHNLGAESGQDLSPLRENMVSRYASSSILLLLRARFLLTINEPTQKRSCFPFFLGCLKQSRLVFPSREVQ